MSTTYNKGVAPAQEANKRVVEGASTDLSGLEKFAADNLPAGSVSDEDNKAQVAQKLLDKYKDVKYTGGIKVDYWKTVRKKNQNKETKKGLIFSVILLALLVFLPY